MRTLKLTGILLSSLTLSAPQVMAESLKMSLNDEAAFELKDEISYRLTDSTIDATSNQAIICHNVSGDPSASRIKMTVRDPNGEAPEPSGSPPIATEVGVVGFVQSIATATSGSRSIMVSTDSTTRCVTADGFSGGSELIFFSGFEAPAATTPSPGLSVVFEDLSDSVTKNLAFTYKYRITNNSSVEKTFDFVDYFTKAVAVTGASGAITDPYIISPGSAGTDQPTWNCQVTASGDSCGSAPNGTAAVELKGATLAAGRSLTVEVTRTTSNHTGTVDLLAAIFANDDDETDNKVYKALSVVDNMSPTISITSPQTILEGGSKTIDFTVSDPDGDVNSVSVAATINNPSGANIITSSGIVLSTTGTDRTVTVTPEPHQYTTPGNPVTITLTATDGGGATATTAFDVTVTLVNEKPTFEVKPVVVVNLLSFTPGTPATVDCNSSGASGSSGSLASLNVGLKNCIYNIDLGTNEHNSQEIDSVILGDQDSTPAIPGVVENDPADPIISVSSTMGGAQVDFQIVDRDTVTIKPTLTEKAGAAQVTLRLKDNGGTANGGNDTSNSKTFLLKVIKDISITKKAYIGSNIGGSCDNDNVAVSDLNPVSVGDTVTFCYIVTNNRPSGSGNLSLSDSGSLSAIVDNDFFVSTASPMTNGQIFLKGYSAQTTYPVLQPGEKMYFYYEKSITASSPVGGHYQAEVNAQDGGTPHKASNNRFEPVTITVN